MPSTTASSVLPARARGYVLYGHRHRANMPCICSARQLEVSPCIAARCHRISQSAYYIPDLFQTSTYHTRSGPLTLNIRSVSILSLAATESVFQAGFDSSDADQVTNTLPLTFPTGFSIVSDAPCMSIASVRVRCISKFSRRNICAKHEAVWLHRLAVPLLVLSLGIFAVKMNSGCAQTAVLHC